VVARVGSTTITLAELDNRALSQTASQFGPLTLAQAIYEARRSMLDTMIGDQLIQAEAGSRGVAAAVLVEQEISSKVKPPTAADVEAWYRANPARVSGATLEQVQAPIADLLTGERTSDARSAFVTTLKAKTPVVVSLEPPRLAVSEAGRPAKGPEGAPITMIEFSDFQCPFCQRAYATVQQVLSTYGDRIRFVYRHYPLPNHPAAGPAAEASLCADEQGQFWPYHDRLFANAERLSDADLKRHAVDVGLDAAKFNACFDSHKFQDEVAEDFAAGNSLGVNGTPAFFVNGRLLSGAQPFEAFKELIDEELARRP
jgi:protein-disulfide isomerase